MKTSIQFSVILGNNIDVSVKGIGEIIEKCIVLTGLKKKLVSEGVFTQRNIRIVKQAKLAKLYEDQNLIVIARRRENSLYKMLVVTVTGNISIAKINLRKTATCK